GPCHKVRSLAGERDEREADTTAEQKLDLHGSNGRDQRLAQPLYSSTIPQAPSHHRMAWRTRLSRARAPSSTRFACLSQNECFKHEFRTQSLPFCYFPSMRIYNHKVIK
ncbi:unnamed protein product, partial [Prunus brigantina]